MTPMEGLLSMFPPVPTEHWERMIRETVAGPDYASKLIWHPEEGLAVKPYYRAEDLSGLPFLDSAPGEFPFVRGSRTDRGWRISEDIDGADPRESNRLAIESVAAGAEEIAFTHARINSDSDLALLLANLAEIPIRIGDAKQQTIRLMLHRLASRPHLAPLFADLDPLADIEFSAEIIRNVPLEFRPFAFNAREFQEGAAGAIEELAFLLSAGVDFLAEMQDRGIEIDDVADAVTFQFGMGPEFFIQIAKLRAFRRIWAQA